MAFPHPKPREDHDRNEEKPSRVGVLWNFVKRTVNISDDRNAKDNVNPAKNRTLGGIRDHGTPLFEEFAASMGLPNAFPCHIR